MSQQLKKELAALTISLVGNTSFYLYKFRQGTIRELIRRGARVFCIATEDEYSERLERELFTTFVPWQLKLDGANPAQELRSLITLGRQLRRIDPDFVFNFTAKANIYSGIACSFLKLSYANNISGLGLKISDNSPVAKLMAWLYASSNKRATRIFTQNPDDLAYLRANKLLGDTPVTEIAGSGVDLNYFTAQPIPDSPFVFLMIARIQAHKGVREFVDAARIVKEKHKNAHFILLGPTAYTNSSAIPQSELNLWQQSGVIEWIDAVDDVRPYLASSHVLVLPSYREGMPRTVLEAAASGRPAIVTDVPGCKEAVINNETGFICKVRDIESLVAAMDKFINMPTDNLAKMGRAARALAEERFSEQEVIDAYMECLD